jgi:hypothetical protein
LHGTRKVKAVVQGEEPVWVVLQMTSTGKGRGAEIRNLRMAKMETTVWTVSFSLVMKQVTLMRMTSWQKREGG